MNVRITLVQTKKEQHLYFIILKNLSFVSVSPNAYE